MKRFIYVLLFLFTFSFATNGQPVNTVVQDVVMTAPNAAALGKYGDIPVSHHTGVPNISIPIYTVTEGPISLPISITYHASGVKMGEPASWVGLGWSLSAGGMITRTTLGILDEGEFGYFNVGTTLDGQNQVELDQVGQGFLDAEPDIFSFSFAGKSGKFFFDVNGEPQILPRQDILIKKIISPFDQYKLDGFILISSEGTRYIFGKNTTEEAIEKTGGSNFSEYPTSWCLVQIESHDGANQINLTYDTEDYAFKTLATCRYKSETVTCGGTISNSGADCGGTNGTSDTYIRGQRLTSISSSTSIVNFVADTLRDDLDALPPSTIKEAKSLDKISIQSGSFSKQYQFIYDYFEDNTGTESHYKRLQLKSLQESSIDGSIIINPYEFTYEGNLTSNNKIFLPNRLTKEIDHWGYYNGADENNALTVIVPPTTVSIGPIAHSYGSADRESVESFMKYGVINTLKYPTGGFTKFYFEANNVYLDPFESETYQIVETLQNCGSPMEPDCCGTIKDSTTLTLTSEQVQFGSVEMDLVTTIGLFGQTGCLPPPYNLRFNLKVFKIENDTATQIGNDIDFDENYDPAANQPPMELDFSEIGDFGNGGTYKFLIEVTDGRGYLNIRYGLGDNKTVGGLRIQKVEHYDLENTKVMEREYEYAIKSDTSKSSGVLYSKPTYGSFVINANPQTSFTLLNFQSSPVVPLGDLNGYHIGYSRVVEKSSGNGKQEYYHKVNTLTPVSGYPIAPEIPNFDNGLLDTTSASSESNVVLSMNINHWQINRAVAPGIAYKLYRNEVDVGNGQTCVIFSKNEYFLHTGFNLLGRTENILDDVKTITDYEYDSDNHLLPIKEKVTNSDNKIYTTRYEYPFDLTDAVYDSMVSRNQIGIPILTTNEVEDGSVVQTGGTRNTCDFFNSEGLPSGTGNDPIYPYLFERYEMTWDSLGNPVATGPNNGWDTLGLVLHYDMVVGKPDSFQLKGWQPEGYQWDAVNKQILSRNYEDFTWNYSYFSGTKLVKEIIDIDGQDIDFKYDALLRLDSTIARDGNVRTAYEYHYSTGGADKNFVRSRTDFTPTTNSDLDWTESWQYLDGLGRPLQTVQRRHADDMYDVVTGAVRYDNQGRVESQYEPFQGSFNAGTFTNIPTTVDSTYTVYEASPLNRVLSVTPPDWYATTTTYGTNTSSINVNGYDYVAGELNKVSVTDPEENISEAYSDKRGRIILSSTKKGSNKTETRYVYDEKDRVRTILPPAVTTVTSPLAFQYLYDGDDNIVKKFIPDMGWLEMLYDDRNLLTASRDSNLIYENKWLSSINDDYGRVVQTGFHDIGQSGAPNPNVPNIDHLLTETFYDKTCGQTADQYIGKVCQTRSRILGTSDWLEDNMTYDIFGRMIYSEENNHLDLTVGSEKDSLYYDYADNRTRIRRTHQAFGDIQTIIERTHFDHVGRVENTYHKYNAEAEEWLTNSSYTIKDELDIKKMGVANGASNYLEQVNYDYLPNRFLTEMSGNLFDFALIYDNIDPAYNATPYKNGNIATQIWQVQGKDAQFYNYQYDFLNRLTQADYKSITSTGSIDPNNHYSTGYSYDPRGNILTLNREGQLPNTSFGPIDNLDYDYHSTSNQLKAIADLTTGTGLEKGFKPGLGGDYLYDENGNLSYDPHKGLTIHYNFLNLPDTVTNSEGNTIVWLYDATGIKLQKKVVSTATGDVFINDNPIPSNTYYGDKITSAGVIPNSNIVRFEAEQQIKLQSGFKGKGQFTGLTGVTGGLSTTTQDYCNSIEYKNGTLEAIYHTEGRIHFIDATIRYEYVLKDHLGNNRILFSDTNNDGSIDANSEILQITAYYPYGLEFEGNYPATNPVHRYKFNGFERTADFGLGLDLARYRTYDPAIARWLQIDPKAELFEGWTPYKFGMNNPILFNDPNGDCEICKEALINSVVFVAGAANAISSNLTGNFPGTRGDPSDFGAYANAAAIGQQTGDVLSLAAGTAGTILGAVAATGSGLTTPVTGPIGAGGAVALGAASVASAGVAATALSNLTEGNGIVQANDRPNTLEPGPHAGKSVPSKKGKSRKFSKETRSEINEIGKDTGCHTCGTTAPGTKSGNFVPDHQPPNALVPDGTPQDLFPHCINCSKSQGGTIGAMKRKGKLD